MDCRTGLTPPSTAGDVAAIDQAIFTSIRTPMARGYRVVAASRGVSDDERAELVQRAPSHGNLTAPAESGPALSGFVLRSGRHCLLWSRFDGPEPSGRGGLRVFTRALLLDPACFEAFSCDPFRVAAVAGATLAGGLPAGASTLPVVLFSSDLAACATPALPVAPHPADAALCALGAVLEERRVLVTGAPDPALSLHAMFCATPLGLRRTLSFSHGLRLSNERAFQLIFDNAPDHAINAYADDNGYELLAWEAPPDVVETPFVAWLNFAGAAWERGDYAGLRRVANALDEDCSPEALAAAAAAFTESGALVSSPDGEPAAQQL